jgi:hypothetical protein
MFLIGGKPSDICEGERTVDVANYRIVLPLEFEKYLLGPAIWRYIDPARKLRHGLAGQAGNKIVPSYSNKGENFISTLVDALQPPLKWFRHYFDVH